MKAFFYKTKFILMLMTLSTLPSFAQNLLKNNNTLLYISDSASLTINGNFTNEGQTSLENNGLVKIGGNTSFLLDDSSEDLGNFIFISDRFQTLNANHPLNFSNITLNKSDSSIRLNVNITVSDTIYMLQGKFDIHNNNLILGQAGSLTLENELAYITGQNGFIQKTGFISASAATHLGNLGVEIEPSNALGETTIRRYHAPRDVGGAFGIKRYYEFTPEFSPPFDARLTMFYIDNDEERNNIPKYAINTYTFGNGVWTQALALQDTVNNSLTLQNVNFLRPLTGALGNALPVEFLNFTATNIENRQVKLKWSTATEINNDYFTVERSENGYDFESIGEVAGAGNSAFILHYEFDDMEPLNGISYYRIKQTDFDGKFDYSIIRSVNIRKDNTIVLYPNPASGNFINLKGIEGKHNIEIYNAIGSIVKKDVITSQSKTEINKIDIVNLMPGTYFLKIIDSNGNSYFTNVLIL